MKMTIKYRRQFRYSYAIGVTSPGAEVLGTARHCCGTSAYTPLLIFTAVSFPKHLFNFLFSFAVFSKPDHGRETRSYHSRRRKSVANNPRKTCDHHNRQRAVYG